MWIENSVMGVTVRHLRRLAEWCRTVFPSNRIFNSYRTTIMNSFSCIHAFKIKYALVYQLNLTRLRKISVFAAKTSESLLMTRQNDNHSPGPGRLVLALTREVNLATTSLAPSAEEIRVWKCIPVPNGLGGGGGVGGGEATLINITCWVRLLSTLI